jgi:hypothetical protein
MRKVSRHLYHLYVKREIFQLTDHEYDMSMPTFYNYSIIALLIELLRSIVRHGTLVREV